MADKATSQTERLQGMLDGLAEYIESALGDELMEDARANGSDPDEVAAHVKNVLLQAAKNRQPRELSQKMDQNTAIQIIDNFLHHHRLGNSGVSGFEGLVAVLFQQATGQEFRLSSSGRQSGGDAATESGYANRIKIEAKHYLQKTALDLRELIAEIEEATEADPALDIWVLATSRSVSDQTSNSLDKQAESHGVEVVLLDLGINGLPRLAVLMAAFPSVVLEWADRHQLQYNANELQSALLAISSALDFESAKTRLLGKLAGSIGYDSARRRIHNRLLATLGDDKDARSAFRQSLGIRTSDAQVIRRSELTRQLDQWWDIVDFPQPVVALGEEGTGKTWAIFDWAIGRIERGDMPIVLPFAAVAEELSNSEPIERLLPRLLARWTSILDETRWRRRLHRWLNAEATDRPVMLLIVDGLNERAAAEWPSFFTTLLSAPWRDKIAILATDRPHHWRARCARAGLATFREITVGHYSDAELDHALSASHISHHQIPHDLLELISTPRYCRLVADHYQEMIDAADFTRERLIYLEVKNRQSSKLQYPLTDHQLFEIIRDVAQRARANPEVKPGDLMSLIVVPGGDAANIYEEIVSGGLLVPVPGNGMTERYKVAPLRLVFGFGMLLAEELAVRTSSSSSEIEEFLTSWFEPQGDMDLKVDICGSAMFHALFRDDFPEVPLRELIRYWLGLRNWADNAQSAFGSYVVRRPEIFVGVAEDFWSSRHDSGAAQEFLGTAFTVHRDNPTVQPVLARAVERWMGLIHPLGRLFREFDPVRNEQIRKSLESRSGQKVMLSADEVGKEDRTRKEIETRAGCPMVPGEIEVAGHKLTVISDGHLLRMGRFGLMIISAGDPLPFVSSLVHWAVASAVMDDSDFSDLVSWVVRLSDGNVDTALLAAARSLLERNESTASAAARILLFTIGTSESQCLIDEHGLMPQWHKELLEQHASDPCKSLFAWTKSEGLACLGREDIPLHVILDRATLPIVDPSVALPDSLLRRAKEALQTVNPAKIRSASFNTIENHNLETVTQILCARAPSEIANFIRAVVRTMPDRDLTGQYYLGVQIPEISLLLRPEEVIAVSRAIADLSSDASEWSAEEHSGPRHTRKIAEARAFSGIAPHLSSSEFFRRFMARSSNALDLISFELWFAPVSADEWPQAINLLHAPPDQTTLYRILWAVPHLKIPLSEFDRSLLVHLAESEDSKVRAGAMRVAVIAHDERLGRRIVDLGRSPNNKDADPWEEQWLTFVLAQFAKHLPFDDLVQRLRPSSIGFVIGQRGNRPNEIEIYAKCLDQEWQRIVSAADVEIERLPEIVVGNDPGDRGVPLPRLREPAPIRSVRLDRSDSWTSGRPINPASELKELFGADNEHRVQQLNQDLRRKVDAILAAWQTHAFQWYGRTFSREVMDLLYQQFPAHIEAWIQPALNDSLASFSVRIRLGSFLEPICRVLLNRNPELGLLLWRILHTRENNPIVFETCDIAFGAEDSVGSKVARKIAFDRCWDDASIARVAFACDKWNRRDWRDEAIEELISAKRLWKRAKGLTLASFSDLTAPRFEELISAAAVENTWVEQSLGPLRENIHKNRLARRWYSVFLTSEDSDTAWGAFQLVLALADERFLNWHAEIEGECAGSETAERRLRFLSLGWEDQGNLRKEIDRERQRKDLLFGLKIQRGEIIPFMRS
jgi:hypothetical protein